MRGIVETGARALATSAASAQRGTRAEVTVSVSTHVPKPHTPFQWCAMDTRDEVAAQAGAAARRSAPAPSVELQHARLARARARGHLRARRSQRSATCIERAYQRGARFDSWDEQLKLDVWDEAFDADGIDPQRFLGTIPVTRAAAVGPHRRRPRGRLPRARVPQGAEEPAQPAVRQGRRARSSTTRTSRTPKPTQRKLVCYDCGVACDLTAMRDERIEFLIKLGAEQAARATRRSRADAPPRAPSAGRTSKRARKRRPRAPDQGEPMRLRLHYEKLGRAAFGSHLDLVRLLPRLFRRLALPLYYSLGFHQKPVMVFGPALSLGVHEPRRVRRPEARGARADSTAPRCPSCSARRRSTACASSRRCALGADDPKLSRVIDEAVYVAGLPRVALELLGVRGRSRARRALGRGRARPAGRAPRHRRHRQAHRRRQLPGRGARRSRRATRCERAGLVGDLTPVEMRVRITGAGTAKATEVLEALLGRADVPARFVRAALLCTQGGVARDAARARRASAAHSPPSARGTVAASALARRGVSRRDEPARRRLELAAQHRALGRRDAQELAARVERAQRAVASSRSAASLIPDEQLTRAVARVPGVAAATVQQRARPHALSPQLRRRLAAADGAAARRHGVRARRRQGALVRGRAARSRAATCAATTWSPRSPARSRARCGARCCCAPRTPITARSSPATTAGSSSTCAACRKCAGRCRNACPQGGDRSAAPARDRSARRHWLAACCSRSTASGELTAVSLGPHAADAASLRAHRRQHVLDRVLALDARGPARCARPGPSR